MAFKQVFYALREVFPQVDLRILKAVASQYSSDVDAAVEFVLSDVLPAVSEPTETHYTIQDTDYAKHDHIDSEKPKLYYGRISLSNQGAREDTNVLFSSAAGSSGIPSESDPSPGYGGPLCTNNKMEECSQVEDKVVINETRTAPTVDYAQVGSSSTSAAEPLIIEYKQPGSGAFVDHCPTKKDKMVPKAENIDNHNPFNDNYELSDLFAFSGSMLPLFMQSPSDCAVKHEGQMPLKLSKAESIHDFSMSEDNYNLETLFVNCCSIEDRHTPKNMTSAPTFQTHSKSEDNYDLQVLFENVDSSRKELDVLHTAENTPELHKLENDGYFYNLFEKPCIANEQSLDKLDNQCNSFYLFASSKITNNSLHIFEEKDNSPTVDSKEQPSIDFKNPGTFITTCNLNDDFNLSKLFSSTQNVLLSDPDSKCEVRDESEREILCSNTVDKHSMCPIIEHDAFPLNGMKVMPGADKSEEFLDISTQSHQIAEINEFISDFTKSKDALSCLYESTTIKMKEVELQEGNSRQAKQDAVEAHQDFLAMLEHYNQLIENSKESNDKQAQIVWEEKSSLAALAQDLQSRITKLSAQRDEALTIVEEIKFELDAQIATSMEEEAIAREQICQEEKLTLLVRKEKEATMESIMEESRKVQKEARENILLKGLLLDRGHIIDILQGEISSIHANAVALKERTRKSKLESTLVTTSGSATSSHIDYYKSTSIDRDQSLGSENKNGLPQEMARSYTKDHAASSDDEWEVLERTQA